MLVTTVQQQEGIVFGHTVGGIQGHRVDNGYQYHRGIGTGEVSHRQARMPAAAPGKWGV